MSASARSDALPPANFLLLLLGRRHVEVVRHGVELALSGKLEQVEHGEAVAVRDPQVDRPQLLPHLRRKVNIVLTRSLYCARHGTLHTDRLWMNERDEVDSEEANHSSRLASARHLEAGFVQLLRLDRGLRH